MLYPDPSLQVTPEKPSTCKSRLHFESPPRIKFDSLLLPTPEKVKPVDRNILQHKEKQTLESKSRVRFELEEDDSAVVPDYQVNFLGSNLQREMKDTSDDANSSSSTLGASTVSSDSSDHLSCVKAAALDMFGVKQRRLAREQQQLSGKALQSHGRHIRPTLVNKQLFTKPNESVQKRINQITRPKETFAVPQRSLKIDETKNVKPHAFVKRKSGLKRYTHKVKQQSLCDLEEKNQVGGGTLFNNPKYQSSLIHGHNLQV